MHINFLFVWWLCVFGILLWHLFYLFPKIYCVNLLSGLMFYCCYNCKKVLDTHYSFLRVLEVWLIKDLTVEIVDYSFVCIWRTASFYEDAFSIWFINVTLFFMLAEFCSIEIYIMINNYPMDTLMIYYFIVWWFASAWYLYILKFVFSSFLVKICACVYPL